jgi:hypothetical protein
MQHALLLFGNLIWFYEWGWRFSLKVADVGRGDPLMYIISAPKECDDVSRHGIGFALVVAALPLYLSNSLFFFFTGVYPST